MTDHRLPPIVAQRIELQAATIAELRAEIRRAAADLDDLHARMLAGVPAAVALVRGAPDALLAEIRLRRWVDGSCGGDADGDA
jgi:hypothetical protein